MNNIAIVGAGPVGLAEACLLKAMNPHTSISVYEKRGRNPACNAPSNGRSHGLVIAPDSVSAMQHSLQKALCAGSANRTWAKEVDSILQKFKDKKFVSTKQIESDLAQQASKMGVQFFYNASVNTKEDLEKIKDSVIIAADGAHSKVRDLAITAEKVHEKTYQYLVELKFRTPHKAHQPHDDLKISSKVASTEQVISIGHQGKTPNDSGYVEATELILVNEQIHNLLLQKDAKGKIIKGNHAHPWKREELQHFGYKNPKIDKIYRVFERKLNGREPIDYKVTTLPLSVYRSKNVVSICDNKIFTAVGDASSGLILYRGLNKGWIEAAYLADSISSYLKSKTIHHAISAEAGIPKEFTRYQNKAQHLFAREKFVVELKDLLIKIGQLFLKIIFTPFIAIFGDRYKHNRKDINTGLTRTILMQ